MTAPRKPVAWQWLDTATFRKNLPEYADPKDWRPLYLGPDLREILAALDKLDDIRSGLEAMQ